MESNVCPLCGSLDAEVGEQLTPDRQRVEYLQVFCPVCGRFDITDALNDELKLEGREWKKQRLVHLLAELYQKNIYTLTDYDIRHDDVALESVLNNNRILIYNDNEIPINDYKNPQKKLSDFLRSYPKNIVEKALRGLQNIARVFLTQECTSFSVGVHTHLIFAITDLEIYTLCLFLENSEWIMRIPQGSSDFIEINLSAKGWQKFEELEKDWQNSNTAFVAMWFDKSMNAYREAVRAAIKAAGYDDPVIIDSYEHNNFIMDEVINQINEARFVIADFTCVPEQPEENGKIPGGVRGGVYFEAGYARGLGKEVIVTCCDSDDAKKRRHFDIDQLNTLFWHEEGGKLYDGNDMDFTKRLAERIKATVGKGKLH
jgi:nucleoside 2-deoxyribosyltransferase